MLPSPTGTRILVFPKHTVTFIGVHKSRGNVVRNVVRNVLALGPGIF